ncbi:uncharacterized protein [Clytia hemisphaerica]|uniref:uncharacterized protein n=1 Tax=Clytia hemisphaerica TaxID=252671 RepID=UPI0034D44267
MRVFEEVEGAGSEITYRCPNCRNCNQCKYDESTEAISIKEEIEQSLINSSVTIDPETRTTSAILPFITDPSTRLANNKDIAMKVFGQQLRKLNKPSNHSDKEDILTSESKLQSLGYVDYVSNLPESTQQMLSDHQCHHYIPWRAVWKGNSISTPCRIVFDASSTTSSGYSLNDLLAKGRNTLNRLQEVLIRFFIHPIAMHTDIKKMYNTIKLDESHWCYQRYVWEANLDPSKIPQEKVVKTLIYGVKSSGNQAEYGLRRVAEMSKDEYPEIEEIVKRDIYVDDCLTGEQDRQTAYIRADQLERVISRGGFNLKGFVFSGEDPPPTMSEDGEMIHIAGFKWYVKSDMVSLNIGDLNFAKKSRGKKPSNQVNVIPSKLTRRHCASKVAEMFDLTGKVSPLVASMKIDLQDLVQRKLDWDDVIPETLRPLWESNFQLIQEAGNLRFNRAVVPVDAVNLTMETLDFGDASSSMVCVAIYARFLRTNGEYSCQLIFSRTRAVPKGMSQPRGELYAALINTHTGEIVKRSLSKWHQSSMKFTDSQIVLYWLDNDQKPLKQWVRNRVIESLRFTTRDQWKYVPTDEMIADIGTRKGATVEDVNKESTWINGHNWMHQQSKDFPVMTAQELRLTDQQVSEVNKEVYVHHVAPIIPEEVGERYKFSSYLIDPNVKSFSTVVRIMGYVYRYFNNLRSKIRSNGLLIVLNHPITASDVPQLKEVEVQLGERYFLKLATQEVIKFVSPKKYEPISILKDNILTYKGRILPNNGVTIAGKFTDAMLDLSQSTFCVPVIDRHSPVAYSLVIEAHWLKHDGIEATLRRLLKKVFIIEGRTLVKTIKRSCERCRYLEKRTVEAIMGPIPSSSLTIAPAFYQTQVDLSGPYKSISPTNKRATIKIWLVIYCCCSTSAVHINTMDDYSSPSFIQSFTRFSSRYGFPIKLYCDEGSQLVKSNQDIRMSFTNIQSTLFKDRKVEFETCPVGAHNVNGKVERKIREVNLSIEKIAHNERLSILQWETLGSIIANSINDLPLLVGNITETETMDLLTPNRLILGRNNDRSPSGDFVKTCNPIRLLETNSKVYDAWFENWLECHVPKLMKQTKWFRHERNLQIGDVVLFTKVESALTKRYTYGMIKDVVVGDDGNVRKVTVSYQNENESVKRETVRSVRNLVLIHSVDDPDLFNELHEMSECYLGWL